MNNSLRLTVIAILLAVSNLSAATLQVSPGSMLYSNIQQAVDAAATGDQIVVFDGVYATGGRTWARVDVAKPVTVRSVHGPQLTVIDGGGVVRCVLLTDGAILSGFTLTNGACYGNGAGVVCTSTNAVLTNCTLAGNVARAFGGEFTGGYGGGAYRGTLYNCTLSRNTAILQNALGYGGGAYGSTLYNCTLTDNSGGLGGGAYGCTLYKCTLTGNGTSKGQGGGAYRSTLYNCTLTGNYAAVSGGGANDCTLYNCMLSGNGADGYWYGVHIDGSGGGASGCTLYNCTLTGNQSRGHPPDCTGYGGGASGSMLYNCIVYANTAPNGADYYGSTLNCCWTDADPLFVAGNLRLQSNSPCVNAGNNAYVTTSTDFDGRPRVISGTVDIGAYEFQGPFNEWLEQYGLPTDGSADFADADADRMNNWQEWACNTCPTNPLSVLCLLSATPSATNVTVSWQSVAGVNYFLERSASLASPFMFVATNILGQAGTTSYADTNATGAGPFFYRVGVNCP